MARPAQTGPVYLTIPEVARLVRLGQRTIYDMCRDGRLPGVAKVGGKWRVERQKLLTWMEARGEAASDGVEQELTATRGTR